MAMESSILVNATFKTLVALEKGTSYVTVSHLLYKVLLEGNKKKEDRKAS